MTPWKKRCFCRHRKEVNHLPLIDFQKVMLVSREVNALAEFASFLGWLNLVIVVLKRTTNKTNCFSFIPPAPWNWNMYTTFTHEFLSHSSLGKYSLEPTGALRWSWKCYPARPGCSIAGDGGEGGWNQAVKMWGEETAETVRWAHYELSRWWQLKHFLFSPLPGEMIQFD